MAVNSSGVCGKEIKSPIIKAMVIFTNGPAKATNNSSVGFSGNLSNRAKPPIGKSVMSLVWILYFLAISACPNSCNRTVTKTLRINSTDHADCRAL
ncbi:hypothetical protein D3C80_2000260 [compost metagenome]